MTVRIRGIYATALTAHCSDVVQPSSAIADRVDESLPDEPAGARITTTADRQGVEITGDPARVEAVRDELEELALDALAWPAALPQGAIFAGEVVETLGSGALVDVDRGTGFLPFGNTDRRIETDDTLRVQVAEPRAPWLDERPVLDTAVRIRRPLVALERGGAAATNHGGGPVVDDIVEASPPPGWATRWQVAPDSVSLTTLSEALDRAATTATVVDEALESAAPPPAAAPATYWTGVATTHCWFGRQARFTLDDRRRSVTRTMAGHHRIKAGTEAASAAVDFVEAVCGSSAATDAGGAFPFEAVTEQFGPTEGDAVVIDHGKPDGSLIRLGRGTVTDRQADGTVVVERELTGGGTYDGLGVDREAGDVATTKFKEGRWWYPTAYRSTSGELRGTYVNVCTPVEVFPSSVRYVDLHVDVVKHADGRVERLDDDELSAAVDAGDISVPLAEKARSVAAAIEDALG